MNHMYAAIDAMSDDERNDLAQYMAGKSYGAKAYQAGDPPDGEVENEKEPDAEAGTYNQSPADAAGISGEGAKTLNTGGGPEPKKTEHTVTTYARGDQALKYQLDEMKTRLAKMERERDDERVKAIDAERMNRLMHYHHEGYLPDPSQAFEKLCYSKLRDADAFDAMLELLVGNAPKIPVDRYVPNFPGAERHVYERAREQLNATKSTEKYSKEEKDAAMKAVMSRINSESSNGRTPDPSGWYEQELEKVHGSRNGAAA